MHDSYYAQPSNGGPVYAAYDDALPQVSCWPLRPVHC